MFSTVRSAMRFLTVAALFAIGMPVRWTHSEEWSRFRGPGGAGRSDATNLPVQWGGQPDNKPTEIRNVVWRTALPGAGASSPIVWGEQVYVTAYTGYLEPDKPGGRLADLKRHLLSLRRDTGRVVWDQAVDAVLPEPDRIRDHGYAASTPVADAERVYVFFGKSGVLAFDHAGQRLWQADVGSGTNGWGSGASPILFEDLVIVNASVESQSLVALDRRTGTERWRLPGTRESWNTPIVVSTESGGTELVLAVKGRILGIDPRTGKQRWFCETDIGWYMVPSCVTADGVVYCLGGRSGTAALAVRAGGTGDVTASRRLWTSPKGANVSSPVIHEGRLYWANEARGLAYCADGASGAVIYEQKLERAGQIYASALLAGGRLYYLTRDGRTFVAEVGPTFKLLAVNDLRDGSVFNGSPAVDGSRLLIRSDKFLYCIGATTRDEQNRQAIADPAREGGESRPVETGARELTPVAIRSAAWGPGDYDRTVTVGGLERSYLVHVPPQYDGQRPTPVVLVFHGGGSNADQMVRFCGLNETADQQTFITVYPRGTGRLDRVLTFNGGNCCGYAMQNRIDDVGFVRTLLDDLATVVQVDARRVFATGMSNGAIMSYRLASELSDRIAAIAPVGGPMGTDQCHPQRPLSVIHFHGQDDEHAPFSGGKGKGVSGTNFFSVEHSIQAWIKANRCRTEPTVSSVPDTAQDGTTAVIKRYSGGTDGAEVVLVAIRGAGHTWPGQTPLLKTLGKSTKNVSANDMMWKFFQQHPLQ